MIEAHHNKGFNLANVFAVGFFWPAYNNNVLEADNAEEWVQRRRVMLTDLYVRKGCAPGIAADGTSGRSDRQAIYESGLRNYNR
jgi:hypothetical protein